MLNPKLQKGLVNHTSDSQLLCTLDGVKNVSQARFRFANERQGQCAKSQRWNTLALSSHILDLADLDLTWFVFQNKFSEFCCLFCDKLQRRISKALPASLHFNINIGKSLSSFKKKPPIFGLPVYDCRINVVMNSRFFQNFRKILTRPKVLQLFVKRRKIINTF